MEHFFQAAAAVMAAVVLWIMLSKQGKEYALLLSIGACALIMILMFRFLEPVLDQLKQLEALGNLQPEWLNVMLKAVGIGIVVEMGSLICTDAGNAALGKTLQFLGTGAILWLSIPLVDSLIKLLQQILGDV
jgi:stage III sporulation protein AD